MMTQPFVRLVGIFLAVLFVILAVGGVVHLHFLRKIEAYHAQIQEEWSESGRVSRMSDDLDDVFVQLLRSATLSEKIYSPVIVKDLNQIQARLVAFRADNDRLTLLSPDHVLKEDAYLDKSLMLMGDLLTVIHSDGAGDITVRLTGLLDAMRGQMRGLQRVYTQSVAEALLRSQMYMTRVKRASLALSVLLAGVSTVFLALFALLLARQTRARIYQEKMTMSGLMAAQLAHEVRNPLAIIKSSASVLKKGCLAPEETVEMTGYILDESDRIDRLVTDLLRVRQPQRPILARANMHGLVDDVIQSLQIAALEQGVIIRQHSSAEEVFCVCDRKGVRQMVLNLLLNALEVTSRGGVVEIEVSTVGTACRLIIKDFGRGLARAVRDRLFEPFVTTRANGLGLGLSVVRRIADEHRASIDVQSAPGKGTTFIINFPSKGRGDGGHA